MTNSIFEQTYSSKSVAKRGAGRAGLAEGTYTIEARDGRFAVVVIPVVEPEQPQVAAEVEVEVVDLSKVVTLKSLIDYEKSKVPSPVDFVHAFLDNTTGLTRKEAIIALVEAGVNYSTARTQYQRWYSKRKNA